MAKKISGMYEGQGFRLFNGKKFKLGQTAKKKSELLSSAKEMRLKGYNVRLVPISIGWAEYLRKN